MAKAKRGVQRPTKKSEYVLRHADRSCEVGWTDLCASQRNSCADLFDRLTGDPTRIDNPDKQHRLKGGLSTAIVGGVEYDQWQYEMAKGARVWYVSDEATKTVLLTNVATAHPNQTK
jgi:hypothetical protein